MDEREVLKRYFGYDAFRPGQGEVVRALLEGRDALCVMPTGAGKSLCYQVPALLLKGVTLVVSPLISLMKDQVAALNQAGVRAAYLNSSLTPRQFALALENARQGLYRVIYVAPERLETPAFQDLCREIAVPLVAVDEAHCVSQWGQDFRPSYLRIRDFVESLPARPVLGTFTATATPEVRDDIRDLLGLQDPFCVATGFDRPNLRFAVENVPQREKTNALLRLLREQKGRSGIVYCLARRTVEEVCEALRARGIAATRYHAGLSDAERRQNQDDFLYDRAEVMVATNAFGMGIDKSNVAFVIHYNMPKNLESYYQEAGRAGRDGSNAVCTLLYSGQDVKLNAFLIEKEEENPLLTEEQARAVREGMREGLRRMARYCTTGDCLRGYILRYFGEKAGERCGNCSNCDEENQRTMDASEEARAAIRCVQEMGERYGRTLVQEVLRGSGAARVQALGLQHCASFGALRGRALPAVRALLDALLDREALESSGGEYPVLRLGPRAQEILDGAPVRLRVRDEAQQEEAPRRRRDAQRAPGGEAVDEALLAELKALRNRLAAEAHVPAYVVFSDATLRDMCAKRPATPEEFLEVSGVGEYKLRRYGKEFLRVLRR